jgi:hypothetical protein
MGAGAAPGPVERMLDEAGFDRVLRQVAADGDELRVASDLPDHCVGTEEVGGASVATVVPARVLAVEALERLREPGVGYSHERVVVGSHQYVGEERELEALPGGGQPLEEVLPILVVHEQVARIAAARSEVVDAGVEVPRRPGHAAEARPPDRPESRRHPFGALSRHFRRIPPLPKPWSDPGLNGPNSFPSGSPGNGCSRSGREAREAGQALNER